MQNTNNLISELIGYSIKRGLIGEEDAAYAANGLCEKLGVNDYEAAPAAVERPLCEILSDLCEVGLANGKIPEDTVVYRDLFDTALMGVVTPRPSEVIRKFRETAAKDPVAATDEFYRLACDSNYIRTDRIAKDRKWTVESVYGTLDITVNLSKPEKDPKMIAAARNLPAASYPKCALCHENEGFAGSLNQAARQNLRQIPLEIAGKRWFLQYSPYVYYNEHCIALSAEHSPMKIDRTSFEKALDFVTLFPHYFIGQNADLPIVGGSILTHDHMQGGRYTFAMEKAPISHEVVFRGFENVKAGVVRWPMSVIRLTAADKGALVELADRILAAWRKYSDPEAGIFAETDGEPHNTVTPIARRRGTDFELDLVLRNNLTTPEHPLGVFHPHAERHNIKKENIGLIEVMGLAVLPARLKKETDEMAEAILAGKNFADVPGLEKHAAWFEAFRGNYEFTAGNVRDILEREIGKTFVAVLEDAGVYKDYAPFRRFLDAVGTV